jgi:hypothetical protein
MESVSNRDRDFFVLTPGVGQCCSGLQFLLFCFGSLSDKDAKTTKVSTEFSNILTYQGNFLSIMIIFIAGGHIFFVLRIGPQ